MNDEPLLMAGGRFGFGPQELMGGLSDSERLRELMRVRLREGFGARGGLGEQWRRSLSAADPMVPENQGQPPEAHFSA